MPEKDLLSERGRALEDEYFRRKDRELMDRLRETSAADAVRRELGELTGLAGADVAALQLLGFTPETISLLPLVPLIQVAWAEGGITERERELLVQFARSRGITAGSAADTQLSRWLTSPPESETYAGVSRVVGAMLNESGFSGGVSRHELLNYAERIAAASGGFFGRGKISADEKAILETLAVGGRPPRE